MPTNVEVRAARILAQVASEASAVNVQKHWKSLNPDTEEPVGYRHFRPVHPLGYATSSTDLPEEVQRRMQENCLLLYQSDPIAHRFVEMMVDYLTGNGIRVSSPNEELNGHLKAFWSHPDNRMEERLPNLVRELSIYGEVLLGLRVDSLTGFLRLFYMSPAWIEQVTVDSKDISHFQSVTLLKDALKPSSSGREEIRLLSIDPSIGLRVGEAIFLTINRVSDGTRGISDLLPHLDSLSNLDTFMFNTVERARNLSNYFWDITYQGATSQQLEEYYRSVLKEGNFPGTYRMHNEKVSWEGKSPELQALDVERIHNAMFSRVVTGLGWPPHWTGLGGMGAKAGAESAADPAYHMFSTRQGVVKQFIQDVINFQIDQLIAAKRVPFNIDRSFSVEMPRIAVRDFQRMGGAFNRMVDALLSAMEQGVYTKEEVKSTLDSILVGMLEGSTLS